MEGGQFFVGSVGSVLCSVGSTFLKCSCFCHWNMCCTRVSFAVKAELPIRVWNSLAMAISVALSFSGEDHRPAKDEHVRYCVDVDELVE